MRSDQLHIDGDSGPLRLWLVAHVKASKEPWPCMPAKMSIIYLHNFIRTSPSKMKHTVRLTFNPSQGSVL